jgi:transketolase
MRNTFINTLCDIALTQKDIFLLCGDIGYSVLEKFRDKFPDRFLNVGIAEQNMTQVAAGLAKEGYNVFTYSIGNFPTLRCMEQIRYDICYHKLNVKIISVGSGYAYGALGVSHHTTEDIAMIRSIPNIIVCSPGDPIEAKASASFMSYLKGPGYIRLNKSGEAVVHDNFKKIKIGKYIEVIKGANVGVLSTGAILSQNFNEIKNLSLDWGLYSFPFIGNYNEIDLIKLSKSYDTLVTTEEHQVNGGFGSSIIEAYNKLYFSGKIKEFPKIIPIGIPNKFLGCSGNQDFLRNLAGITLNNPELKKFLANK